MLRLSFLYMRDATFRLHRQAMLGQVVAKLLASSSLHRHRCAYLRSWAFDAAVSSFSLSLRFFSASLSTGNVFRAFSYLALAHLRIFFAEPSFCAESQTASTTSGYWVVWWFQFNFGRVAEIALLWLIYNAFQGIYFDIFSGICWVKFKLFTHRGIWRQVAILWLWVFVCVCARGRTRTDSGTEHTQHTHTHTRSTL